MEEEEGGAQRSLEETPTWAVSVFCLFFLAISFCIEAALHQLTYLFLRKRKRKSLNKALTKTKSEMMKLGFLSFLLTISQVPVSKICMDKAIATTFVPCQNSFHFDYYLSPQPQQDLDFCQSKGMVGLVSSKGIEQLNIFISVLAVFHILYCILTMFLGMAKMRRWERWEDETLTLEYQIANDPRRFQITSQTLVGKRHLKFWSKYPPLLWMVCFFRQFYGSVTKADYFTLRNGFIAANVSVGSNFNFQKFLARAYDEDFEKVVGIRFWIWIFSMFFIFLSAHEFYNHYWLPFIPLVVGLIVGTKLEMIITKMCVESSKERPVTKGTVIVKPNDHYFWFGRPHCLLHLLHLILIHNSFQLTFFTWTWYEYGLSSCFNRQKENFAIKIAMALAVQLLCAYVTLPLYALVTQMGSGMRKAVFTEVVVSGLKKWHKKAKHSLAQEENTNSRAGTHSNSISLHSKDNSSCSNNSHSRKPTDSDQCSIPDNNTNSDPDLLPPSEEGQKVEQENYSSCVKESNSNMVITRGSYDGEISFGSSWKNMMSSRATAEITSILQEHQSDAILSDDINIP